MTYTSLYAGRVRQDTASLEAADQPLDTGMVRDVANNLAHYADTRCAQVRVAWPSIPSALSGGQGYLTPEIATVDAWAPIITLGPWSFTCRKNGSYRLRIRLGGSSSDNTHNVYFRAMLASMGSGDIWAHEAGSELSDDATYETVATASSTDAWLTGASVGSGYDTWIVLSGDDIDTCRVATSVPSPTSTDVSSIDQCLVKLFIFGKRTNAGGVPHLTGVYAAEYIG